MEIPKDNKIMTGKYSTDKGGICGQSCLAVIENSSIQEVLDNWKLLGLEFKGWSGWKQLREYLEKRGYKVKQERVSEKLFNMEKYFIARVQWLGDGKKKEKPFFGWGHWAEASAHTHFILISQDKFFCNETGILDFKELGNYLKENNGVITSYLIVTKGDNVGELI